jgi:hypothetical protein
LGLVLGLILLCFLGYLVRKSLLPVPGIDYT